MAIAGSLVVTVTARTQDFENGMRKTTQTLKLTQQQAAQVTQAMGGLGNAFTQTSTKAQQTSTSLSSLSRTLVGLTAGILSVQGLTSAIGSSVQAAMKLDAMTLSLKAITGSAQGAADAMAFLRATGDRLGVQVDTIAGSYKTLLAATQGTNLGLKETQTVFLGIVEASRAMGLSAEDTAGALKPLTQIIGQQAFQADELRNELGARLPVALQLLVKASNGAFKSVGELFKAMEDGKLKGQVALDLVANFGVVLRQKFAPAAQEAANSAAAAFERLKQAVTDLQVALGSELLPELANVARAITGMLQTAQGTSSAFGQAFTVVIREAASAVIGLAGSIAVLGRAMALLNTRLDDPAAIIQRWNEFKESFLDVVTAQQQILNPPQLTKLNPKLPPLPGEAGALRPIIPGGGEDGKAAKKTAAERESERIAERQNDIIKEITDGLTAQEVVLERGIALERVRLEQRLQAAGFAAKDAEALLYAYDETEKLKKVNEDHLRNKAELVSVQGDLQKALDKELYTEREILRQRLASLGADEAKITQLLTLYDRQVAAEKERKAQEKAIEESLQAQKDHVEKIASLQKQLEPQKRFRSRRAELQDVQKQMIAEGVNEYELAASDVQIATTLMKENWDRMVTAFDNGMSRIGDELSNTFIDMATTGEFSFKRLADSLGRATIEMLADILDLKNAIAGWLKQGLSAAGGGQGGWFQSLLGGMGGKGAGAGTAALQTDISTSMAANPQLFGFGGGMAAGGPVMPGKFYTVGERGPETLVAGGSGTIIPNAGPTFHMTVITNDANSFRMNERQIAAQSARMLAHARRNL